MSVVVNFVGGGFKVFEDSTEEFISEAEKWLQNKKVFFPTVSRRTEKTIINTDNITYIEIVREM